MGKIVAYIAAKERNILVKRNRLETWRSRDTLSRSLSFAQRATLKAYESVELLSLKLLNTNRDMWDAKMKKEGARK